MNEVQKFIEWRNGLQRDDWPEIFVNLQLLEAVKLKALEGGTIDEIKALLFDI